MLIGGAAGTAQADRPVDPVDHYEGTDSFDLTECGLRLHVDVTFGGRFSIQPTPGSDKAFLAHDNYTFAETITLAGADDGPRVHTSVNGHVQETRATLLDPASPTIYQFTGVDSATFRLYEDSGTLLVRSSGAFHVNESDDFCEAVVATRTPSR